jgi:hypothetical protein
VDGKDTAGVFGYHGIQLLDIHLEGFDVGVHEHGKGILLDHGIDGCDKSVGWYDYFVSGSDLQGVERRIDCVRPIYDAGYILSPEEARPLLFKTGGDMAVEATPLFLS